MSDAPVKPLDECVRDSLDAYFKDLGGETPHSLHGMLVNLVEKPLLEVVMARCDGNQSRAADWLGINRNTLRRKLEHHNLL
jgi:Fis family transcriptional regulator, factor for inversion stimulation protein